MGVPAEIDTSRDPDLRLEGFRLWVHDRLFPDLHDFWDSNWLYVTARVEAVGARVEASGAFIRNTEIAGFAKAVKGLAQDLSGIAEVDCLEPNLKLRLEGDGLGHIAIRIDLTPDQFDQRHRFDFRTDQTFLAPFVAGCEAILERYPVRGSPPSQGVEADRRAPEVTGTYLSLGSGGDRYAPVTPDFIRAT